MAGPHENLETAEHAQHAAHEGGRDNKKIALVISVLALFLAFSETFGKASQTEALNLQIEASTTPDEARKAALARQIGEWEKTAARYRSEPEAGNGKGEGTVELMRRALEKEKERDLQFNKYHNFEFASAAFQIGIVLCSAAVITGIVALAWAAIGIGLIGVLFTTTGFVLPTFPHDVAHFFEAMFSKGGHH